MAIYGTCVWGLSDYYVYIKDSLIGGSNAIQNWEKMAEQKRSVQAAQILTNPSKVYWSLLNILWYSFIIGAKLARVTSRIFYSFSSNTLSPTTKFPFALRTRVQ